MRVMKITDREGMMHIVVFVVAVAVSVLALLFYRSKGISLVGGNTPHFPPALISGSVNSSPR